MSAWLTRVIWLMLAIAMGWVIYQFASIYGDCRSDGTNKLVCFFVALLFSIVQTVIFLITTVVKLIVQLMP